MKQPHRPLGRFGAGVPSVFPPLAGSDHLMTDRARSIRGVLAGLSGAMPPLANLTDHEIADVLIYCAQPSARRSPPPVPTGHP